MKHLATALVAIGLSAGAFAALPATTDPTLINIPQLLGGFVLGISGYYLQPSDSNGDLAYASLNTGLTPGFNSEIRSVDPGYDWGWGINAGYIFPNTGNDVNLSYFHFDTDDTDSASLNVQGVTPFSFTAGALGNGDQTNSKAEYTLNQVDLTVGQFINVGCRLILHPNAGLRWTDLERKLNSFYQETPAVSGDSDNMSVHEKSDFSGIGPLLGLDASYYVMYGFGFVGHFDSAVLVGNIDSKLDATETEVPGIATTWNLKTDSTRRIVPVVDAKLGADYTYMFYNTANSDLTLELGWQFTNYFRAVDRIGGIGDVDTGATITGHKTSDLGINGPYISLVLHV